MEKVMGINHEIRRPARRWEGFKIADWIFTASHPAKMMRFGLVARRYRAYRRGWFRFWYGISESSYHRRLRKFLVLRRDNFQCVYCGSKERLTVDHYIPIAAGGSSRKDNLVACCYDCNHKKGKHFPVDNRPTTATIGEILEHKRRLASGN